MLGWTKEANDGVGGCQIVYGGTGSLGGCQIVYGGTGSLHVDLQTPMETPLCKNKEGKGSTRAWPVAAPMPKSDSLREKREVLNVAC